MAIAAPSPGAAPAAIDPAALVDTWSAALDGAAPKILRFLHVAGAADGVTITREVVANRLGMQPRGGHWNAAWKQLRDNGLVALTGDVAELSDLFRSPPP